MLEETAKKAEQDEILENSSMAVKDGELSCQMFYLLATLCRGRALAVVQKCGETKDAKLGGIFAESSNPSCLPGSRDSCRAFCIRRCR